jgi:hypothetical protein
MIMGMITLLLSVVFLLALLLLSSQFCFGELAISFMNYIAIIIISHLYAIFIFICIFATLRFFHFAIGYCFFFGDFI